MIKSSGISAQDTKVVAVIRGTTDMSRRFRWKEKNNVDANLLSDFLTVFVVWRQTACVARHLGSALLAKPLKTICTHTEVYNTIVFFWIESKYFSLIKSVSSLSLFGGRILFFRLLYLQFTFSQAKTRSEKSVGQTTRNWNRFIAVYFTYLLPACYFT